MTFNICVVGCGSMSSHVHGPSHQEYALRHPGVRLAACCDLDAEKAEAYRSAFGFEKAYTDMELMLDTERPDAVCLIVPEHLTAKIAIRILEKGYPLLTEKPPGINAAETRAMIEAAAKTGVPTQVAFNRRSMPYVKKLKNLLVRRWEPGDIMNIRYDFYRVDRRDEDFSTTAIHGIDTVRFLAGADYKRILFEYRHIPGCEPHVMQINMFCEMESGAHAYLSFNPVSGVLLERAVVQTSGNSFMLDLPVENSVDYPGRLIQYEQGSAIEHLPDDGRAADGRPFVTGGFYDENASFFDDIRSGTRPVHDLASGLQSVAVAEAIRNREAVYVKS